MKRGYNQTQFRVLRSIHVDTPEQKAKVYFDNRTTGFLAALIPLLLGILMYYYSRDRKVYGGFFYWLTAIMMIGLGFLLLVLRGIIHDLLSIVVSNLVVTFGGIMVYEGFQIFFKHQGRNYYLYGVLGLYTLVLLYFTYAQPDINIRILVSSSVSFVINSLIGYLLLFRSQVRLRRAARTASMNAFFLALVSLARGAFTLQMDQPTNLFTDQSVFWYTLAFIAGLIVWAFSFFVMNSARVELELEDARQELVKIANTDSLTGIGNRRWFFNNAANEFQRAVRSGRGLACLMMDIDGFKQVNDSHGHAAGDKVLQQIGAMLQSKVRPFDLVARLGGDEFVIAITEVKQKQAVRIAERMRKVIERRPVNYEEFSLPVRISMGLSLYKVGDADIDQILKRADAAMYRAKKRTQRNVVVG